jgi:hypothetical protein
MRGGLLPRARGLRVANLLFEQARSPLKPTPLGYCRWPQSRRLLLTEEHGIRMRLTVDADGRRALTVEALVHDGRGGVAELHPADFECRVR